MIQVGRIDIVPGAGLGIGIGVDGVVVAGSTGAVGSIAAGTEIAVRCCRMQGFAVEHKFNEYGRPLTYIHYIFL